MKRTYHKPGKDDPAADKGRERRRRQADALRRNLLRRKAQARGQHTDDAPQAAPERPHKTD